ncbi:caspase-8 isoform X2 [Anarrhichthys ocellatus]|uniref:caspase-8 isoform X2 n=1 Tax=Anarrhichthys ocellatus TaxID=433405 RepID=UPI0012ED355A|nr:caspase-8-like isoform X2 [Anarrhichthys ocellatus]
MDFQRLLLDVGKALSMGEERALAFLCTDLLGRNPTTVKSASDLFSRLRYQDHLSAERPHLLTELLVIIQRHKLIRDLDLSDLSDGASTPRSLISPYRKLLYNLSEGITDDDLKDVKFLLDKDLPRKKLEENVSTLEVFLDMEHKDLISDNNLNLLETIISKVCPMLKGKISQFKALQVTHTSPVVQESGRPRSMSYPIATNQVPQSLGPERSVSCETPEFPSLAESYVNTSNTSMDFPNAFSGGDESEALSLGLSSLNTETSRDASVKGHLKIDPVEMLPSQENKFSSEAQASQTTNTNTNIEGLEEYPMTAAKRGICLIVNNCNFMPFLTNREGTIFDEKVLHKVFTWLGFEVEVKRDCKREEMLSVLRELGSRNHSQMDCLVCCVLSHGKEGCVSTVDGQTVEIKELKEPFNGLNCASLAEKPKLFFIQACQGTSKQTAVSICADGPAAPSPVCSDASKANDSIPSDADFLLAMSTVPSYVSFRERKKGSWFIQSLCQNLVQMVPRGYDLVSILTKVNADVSKKTDPTGVKKQMPQPAFSLRKKVVFPIPDASPPSLPHV